MTLDPYKVYSRLGSRYIRRGASFKLVESIGIATTTALLLIPVLEVGKVKLPLKYNIPKAYILRVKVLSRNI
jgi:hypothetical protein